MAELDIEKLKLRISEIQEAIKEVRQYLMISEEDFWKDHRNILAIEQLLLRAIEATGGICLHLVAKKLQKGVENIAHCFEILGEHNLLDKKLTESLIRMARFRNLLIHKYWEIDEKRVYEYAKQNLSDFENFISSIKKNFN
ncbi:MAG: DUF86 domain-containing protein [Patescibacteria group bacterium]